MLPKSLKGVVLFCLLGLQCMTAERLQSGEDSPLMQTVLLDHVKQEEAELLETNVEEAPAESVKLVETAEENKSKHAAEKMLVEVDSQAQAQKIAPSTVIRTGVEIAGALVLADYVYNHYSQMKQLALLMKEDMQLAQQFMHSLPDNVQSLLENAGKLDASKLAQLEEALRVADTDKAASTVMSDGMRDS